jgi:hypothetical protein
MKNTQKLICSLIWTKLRFHNYKRLFVVEIRILKHRQKLLQIKMLINIENVWLISLVHFLAYYFTSFVRLKILVNCS